MSAHLLQKQGLKNIKQLLLSCKHNITKGWNLKHISITVCFLKNINNTIKLKTNNEFFKK